MPWYLTVSWVYLMLVLSEVRVQEAEVIKMKHLTILLWLYLSFMFGVNGDPHDPPVVGHVGPDDDLLTATTLQGKQSQCSPYDCPKRQMIKYRNFFQKSNCAF